MKGLDDDERLMGLAFLDISLYCTSIKVFKNFILISDLMRSIWLVTLRVGCACFFGILLSLGLVTRVVGSSVILTPEQEDPYYKFTVICKDLQAVSVMAADFLVHEGQVTFITSDTAGEMRMLDFDPAGELPFR